MLPKLTTAEFEYVAGEADRKKEPAANVWSRLLMRRAINVLQPMHPFMRLELVRTVTTNVSVGVVEAAVPRFATDLYKT